MLEYNAKNSFYSRITNEKPESKREASKTKLNKSDQCEVLIDGGSNITPGCDE